MTAVLAERPTERRAPSVLRSGALMAAGSLVSRATGFVRSAVVAAALGTGLVADGYSVGNSVPTIVYMLLLGGALNAVFVPELVKAAKEHEDGGAAYTDRLLTVCVLALAALTAGAVYAAPAIVEAYTGYTGAQASMTVAFTRYCLPQIFFLGLFTLLGQVLNARGRFGAMMWTPVLNNVVVVAVFGLYLAVTDSGELTAGETALLGWGTTAGIALQALALVPSLRAAEFRWRPRFDWRGSGLAAPLRSAGWLVLLVLTNQAAYWLTTRIATAAGRVAEGAGLAAYNNAYLLWAVPHGIVTVALVTALLPRMSAAAADGDHARVRRDVSYAQRTSAAAIVPAACALFALAVPLMALVFQYGRTDAEAVRSMAWILMALAPGLIALSGQYVCTRAFYALRDTRTPFLLNLVIAALNATLSLTAATLLPARWTVTGLSLGYSTALWAGWALTAYVLRRRLARLATGEAGPAGVACVANASAPTAGAGAVPAAGQAGGPTGASAGAVPADGWPPVAGVPAGPAGRPTAGDGPAPGAADDGTAPGAAPAVAAPATSAGAGAPDGPAVAAPYAWPAAGGPGASADGGGTAPGVAPAVHPVPGASGVEGRGDGRALARLLVAAVPAAGFAVGVVDAVAPAGPLAAGGAGAATILAVFAGLARPLRLTELQTLLTTAAGRLRPRR